MPIQACIFDLDGVVVDTAKYHYQAWQSLANSLGFSFSEEQNEQLKGVSRMKSLDIILGIGEVQKIQEEKEALAHQKNEEYIQLIQNMDESEILPGVESFLIMLKENNIKISLGSASRNAERILKAVGLVHMFDAIVDGRHTTQGKPHPEVFLLGAKQLNVLPQDCIVFEDAPKGVTAANRAGMYSVGVGNEGSLSHANTVISGFEGLDYTFIQKCNSYLIQP